MKTVRYADIYLRNLQEDESKRLKNVEQGNIKLQKLFRSILKETRYVETQKQMLEAIKISKNNVLKKAEIDLMQIQNMIKQGLYEKFSFNEKILKALTGMIYVTGQNDKRYRLGKFNIEINFDDEAYPGINIQNDSNMTVDGHDHPHISDPDEPCFGNVKTQVYKLIGKMEYVMLLELIHKYLCSYNAGNAYIHLPEKDEDGNFDDYDGVLDIWPEVDKRGRLKRRR
ncbi:hypothetical protein LCGC14_2856870 [marine sediment metagenome]|uniref:Uncharacterized protein n=1 Tax=marine sediment metagenome TaxID=412755 RepID=A0A0F8YTK5_9ZZZZ